MGARFSVPIQGTLRPTQPPLRLDTWDLFQGYSGRAVTLYAHPHLVPKFSISIVYLYCPSVPAFTLFYSLSRMQTAILIIHCHRSTDQAVVWFYACSNVIQTYFSLSFKNVYFFGNVCILSISVSKYKLKTVTILSSPVARLLKQAHNDLRLPENLSSVCKPCLYI